MRLVSLLVLAAVTTAAVLATAEAQVRSRSDALISDELVDLDTQRRLGLVTIQSRDSVCSGTLLNRHWVITARHCLAADWQTAPLPAAADVTVTAAFVGEPRGRTATVARVVELPANQPDITLDIVLLYLGRSELTGLRNSTTILQRRMRSGDPFRAYGRGINQYASGVFGTSSATAASSDGAWRTAAFTVSSASATGFEFTANAQANVIAGGDSGGPAYVFEPGVAPQLAGVLARSAGVFYIAGTPQAAIDANPWRWVSSVGGGGYDAVTPLDNALLDITSESPACAYQRCSQAAVSHLLLLN